MTKPLPYRWRPEDPFLATLSDAQELCYRRLMDSCWLNQGLPLPTPELATICRFFPPKDFEKAVWFKIKGEFYSTPRQHQNIYLDCERERNRKISESQSIRAKNKRKKPPAIPRQASGTPSVKLVDEKSIVFGPIKPPVTRRQAPEVPAVIYDSIKEMVEAPKVTLGEPTVSPRLEDSDVKAAQENVVVILQQEKSPEIPLKKSKLNNLTPAVKLSTKTPDIDNLKPDPLFDPEGAWKQISMAYPESGASLNKIAKEIFGREITTRILHRRIFRSVTNYRRHVLNESFDTRGPMRFDDWVRKWTDWEDPETTK